MKRHFLFGFIAALPASLALAQGSDPTAPGTPRSTPTMPSTDSPDSARQRAESDADRGSNASFQLLDSNADGRVSPEEAASDSVLTEVFGKADRNSDGFVDGIEYRRYDKARAKAKATLPAE